MIKRYILVGKDWVKDHSYRPPHQSPKRIDKIMEQMIIKTRKNLEDKLYAQTGALAISYALWEKGINPPPIITINKILKRNNLVHKREKYLPKGVNYPSLVITHSNYVHRMDVVGSSISKRRWKILFGKNY